MIGNDDKENDPFAPPYRIPEEEENEIPASPFAGIGEEKIPNTLSQALTEDVIEDKSDDIKAVILPLVLLLAGSMLFLFGLALILFSHKGRFTLSWDATYWFAYFIVSIPFLYFGWKSLDKIK